uniref:Type I inositol-3,4-bisphosphate 4-phosphatase n=1 Tax=Phytophthora ramorum TaxID=164328 RepID=H3GTT8_PHYRM
MRRRRPQLLLAALAVLLVGRIQGQSASSSTSGSVTADTTEADDCSACCVTSSSSTAAGGDPDLSLTCCQEDQPRDLFGTAHGECSGLPCCEYSGRKSQNHQAWYPCVAFPTCQNDTNKQAFCNGQGLWYYTEGYDWTCTDECCHGLVLDSNVWRGVDNNYPGQTNGTFGVSITPTDFLDVFYPDGMDGETYTVHQIMIANPPGYNFSEDCSCALERPPNSTASTQRESTTCEVSTFLGGNRTYLTVDITEDYQTNDTFVFIFDGVVTPSGMNDSTDVSANVTYTTASNLTPVYFIFNDSENTAFDTYVRVTDLTSGTLSSGSFLPENIYPGNSGNASLTFYTDANIPEGSSIKLTFGSKWGFTADAVWSWELYPLTTLSEDDFFALAATTTTETEGSGTNNFTSATYSSSDNSWTLIVEDPISIGWVSLGVDTVKNPSVAYSGLDATAIEIRNPEDLLIIDGTFSAISVYLTFGATASPYNYVTMVVLVGSLAFCSVAIRKNGLSFSLGSIWTDITAICTVLALCTSIVNNFVWFFTRGSTYFYIMHAYLCFTFTMLTAVCFHWGTVLSLRLRKLPKLTATVAFVALNLLFYAFQIGYLLNYRTLISRVYDSENDVTTLAYQQCNENSDTSATVFSEIQGYLWACYAEDDDNFFLVMTSVTYGIFLVLTFVVMALGVMVMRRGKLLLGNASGPHQVVLVKALRLYYALIGIVTLVYLLSWVVQIISRTTRGIAYPWFYIFTVWLPCSIPPCCLIFLQWNATAQSLRDANREMSSDCSPLSESDYDEIRTPSFAFSTSDRWTEGSLEKLEEIMAEGEATADAVSSRRSLMNSTISPTDDYVGLSMALEMNEDFSHGCFIALQRLEVDGGRDSTSTAWRQISNTDTVMASVKDLAPIVLPHQQRYLYTFLSVPRIPVGTSAEKIRMVVYALNSAPASVNQEDHSEMTAAEVLAAMERTQSSRDFDDEEDSQRTLDSSMVEMEAFGGFQSSQVIDELFEMESPGSTFDATGSGGTRSESNSGSSTVPHSLRVVAEFTVSTGALVTAGARTEQTVLTATEDSYKHFGPNAAPPKLLVNTVIPKAAGVKYGFNGVEGGIHAAAPAISKQYHIREQGLLVVEDLTESRFSNWIPRQILEIVIRYRTKELLIAENDLARLEAYDRQRQKGSDRGIYENLIQQIQDDGDLNRCREWMLHRCHERKEYVELLRQLRRVYVIRDNRKMFFKASTEKKNSQLRFLPINLHLQEMWVGNADAVAQTSVGSGSGATDVNAGAAVYDIVTVGAMAAHVYKFKNGGIFGLEEQHAKLKPRVREPQGSTAAHHQVPLWTEDEQKADDVEWVLGKRMDVCFPQAVAALVTAFTRKVDLALQNACPEQGQAMLEQLSKLGFLFDVESLVSTHGNEAGMLEDMAGAVNELRNIRFVLVDEQEEIGGTDEEASGVKSPRSASFRVEEESKHSPASGPSETSGSSRGAANSDGDEKRLELKVKQRQSMHLESLESAASSNSTNSTNSTGIGGVIDVDVFTSIDDALSETSSANAGDSESGDDGPSSRDTLLSSQSSFSGVGQRLLSTFIKARNHRLLGGPGGNWDNVQSLAPASVDKLFQFTNLVIRVKLRSGKVKLTKSLRHGGPIKVCPVLFTQGINEKQTLANNTGSSVTRLQDVINASSLKTLRSYCDRYCNYTSMRQMQAMQKQERQRDNSTEGRRPQAVVPPMGISREEVYRILGELDKLIGTAGRQARKKRPEILQLSSDLCRSISGGRVTVCKSAKDRTGMSVTLEQGRILVQHHGLREQKKAGIVSVMRSEGVRIENALKNTGRRVFAFNALQRSLLPEEYRCPPQTSGRNVS